MKKTLLAVAIPALLASGAASAVTLYDNDGTKVGLYGQIRMNLEYKDNRDGHGERGLKFRDSGSRFGFNIKHDLGNGLYGVGGLEYGNDTQSNENDFKLKNRKGFVGIGYDGIGEMTFGRVLSPFDDVALSDYTYVYGGVADFDGIGRSDGSNNFIARTGNTFKFMSDDFNGFSFGATYSLQSNSDWESKDKVTGAKITEDRRTDNAFTLSTFYTNKDLGLDVNLGYGRAKAQGYNTNRTIGGVTTNVDVGDATDSIYVLAVQYKIADFAIAADIGRAEVKADGEKDVNNLYGLALKYNWNEKGSVYVGSYIRDGKKAMSDYRETLYVVGTDYRFSPMVRPYIEYAYDKEKIKGEGSEKENAVALGMRIYF